MNFLLLDIGNTKIKYALSLNGVLKKQISLYYKKNFISKAVSDILKREKTSFSKIIVSSLNKNNNIFIKKIAEPVKTLFVSPKIKLPILIDYEKSIGTDRLCSAIAAFKKYSKHKNILVIDMGTATTFNLVSNGVFLGGMISPGIKTAMHSLSEKTELPRVNLKLKVNLINKTTKNAVRSGVVLQQTYFINKSIQEYKRIYKNLFIVVTGGGSKIIGKQLKGVNILDDNLVLEGLNIIALFNENI